jgi:tetratricopeptide (TPR) repeat protein
MFLTLKMNWHIDITIFTFTFKHPQYGGQKNIHMQVVINKLIFIFCIVITNSLFAQKNIDFTKENFENDKKGLQEALQAIKTADSFYEQGSSQYRYAIEPYLSANNFNPNNALLNYKIGLCYIHSNYKFKSLPYLQKALSLNPNVNDYIHYYLGDRII